MNKQRIKGPAKANRLRYSIVIEGDDIRFVEGLSQGDYGVILQHSLAVVGNNIQGVVLDCHGGRSTFYMPLSVFKQLGFRERQAA